MDLRLIAILVLAGVAGLQTVRLADERAAHSKTKADYAEQETQRERAAREDGAEVRRLQNRHASRQQDLLHAHYKKLLELASRAAADRADDDSVRKSAEAYAADRGRQSDDDSPSCRAAKADVGTLTGLLVEGRELAGEGARIVRERDADIDLWYGIATNDRTLTAAPQGSESGKPQAMPTD